MCEKELTPSFLSDYSNPKPFREDLYQLVLPERYQSHPWLAYILAGGKGSGSPLHKDPIGTGAWNALLHGTKKWILFPPDTKTQLLNLPESKHQADPPAYWWQDHYPRIKKDNTITRVEVLQKAGEIMFVPAGWYHAVLNLDTTIAVTQNFLLPEMLPKSAPVIASENPTFSKGFLAQLYLKRPSLVKQLHSVLKDNQLKHQLKHTKTNTDPAQWVDKVESADELEIIRAERAALEEEKRAIAREKHDLEQHKKRYETHLHLLPTYQPLVIYLSTDIIEKRTASTSFWMLGVFCKAIIWTDG